MKKTIMLATLVTIFALIGVGGGNAEEITSGALPLVQMNKSKPECQAQPDKIPVVYGDLESLVHPDRWYSSTSIRVIYGDFESLVHPDRWYPPAEIPVVYGDFKSLVHPDRQH